jgi:hypothetical protein
MTHGSSRPTAIMTGCHHLHELTQESKVKVAGVLETGCQVLPRHQRVTDFPRSRRAPGNASTVRLLRHVHDRSFCAGAST